MKILQIHDHFECIGGAEIYLSEICQGLREQGHTVTKLYLLPKEKEVTLEPTTYRLDRPHGLLNALLGRQQFIDFLSSESPDVVHLHTLFNPIWVNTLAERYPVVLTVHNVAHLCFLTSKIRADNGRVCRTPMGWNCLASRCYLPMKHANWLSGTYQAIVKLRYLHILPRLAKIIAPSQAIVQELLAVGVNEERLVKIPHFTAFKDEHAIMASHQTILFAGRLSWEKGILEFIDMLALLKSPDWFAIIVGDGPLREAAELRAQERNIAKRIRFCGQVSRENIGSYFRAAQVVVFPSIIPESFGLTGIEAMAFSRPVVAFDLGGVREWLSHGETGFAVTPGDIREMADTVNHLLINPALADTMGKKGKEQIESRFKSELHLNNLLATYQDACNAHNAIKSK